MKTVCIVQARMGSTRLPGKVLLPLNGRTVIGEVLTRCKRIPGVDEVVCTVPLGEEDNPLAEEVRRHCILHRWPDGNDVLARYFNAAWTYQAEIIVRVTGDCPLISPELCGAVVAELKRTGADYACNVGVVSRPYPQGFDCEAFTFAVLERAHKEAGSNEREHVTTWMRRVELNRAFVGNLSLDTQDDYKVICAAFGYEPYQRIQQGGRGEDTVRAACGAG